MRSPVRDCQISSAATAAGGFHESSSVCSPAAAGGGRWSAAAGGAGCRTTDSVSGDADGRPGRHVFRHDGARPVSLAGGRQRARDRDVGRVAERRHLRISGSHSVSRRAQDAPRTALRLPPILVPARKGSRFFFSKNDGLQNQNVLYVQKGLDGNARGAAGPQHLVRGRHRPARDLLAVQGRQSRGLRHFAQRVRLAGVQGHRNRDEARRSPIRSSG